MFEGAADVGCTGSRSDGSFRWGDPRSDESKAVADPRAEVSSAVRAAHRRSCSSGARCALPFRKNSFSIFIRLRRGSRLEGHAMETFIRNWYDK